MPKVKRFLATAKNSSLKTLRFLTCKYWGKKMRAYYYEDEYQKRLKKNNDRQNKKKQNKK